MEQLIAKQKALESSPKEAFGDQVYFVSRGKATMDLDEVDIEKLSRKILQDYSKRFPHYVQNQIKDMIHR